MYFCAGSGVGKPDLPGDGDACAEAYGPELSHGRRDQGSLRSDHEAIHRQHSCREDRVGLQYPGPVRLSHYLPGSIGVPSCTYFTRCLYCSKSESERIIYEDANPRDGFILLPDFKWSNPANVRPQRWDIAGASPCLTLRVTCGQLESLYCLAIVHDRSLRSIRDLTASHVKLLQNIRFVIVHFGVVWSPCTLPSFTFSISNRDSSLEVLKTKFGVEPSSVRMYFHYQPTYYHLHVHFSHVKMTFGRSPSINATIDFE